MALGTSGVASADRVVVRGGGGHGVVVHEGFHGGGWHGGAVVHDRWHGGYGYGYRRPIYMGRPVIREHYYNYGYRPGLIVENYPVRDGYSWVRGSWSWNGVEWVWAPGYYAPY